MGHNEKKLFALWQFQKEKRNTKGQILRNGQPAETEPGRNRKYEQTNHKH